MQAKWYIYKDLTDLYRFRLKDSRDRVSYTSAAYESLEEVLDAVISIERTLMFSDSRAIIVDD